MDEEAARIFDSLPEMEEAITEETKMSLLYIAGYVTRNSRTNNILPSKIW